MLEIMPQTSGNIVAVHVTGALNLEQDKFKIFEGVAQASHQTGKFRILLDFDEDIKGMTMTEAIEMASFVIEQQGQLEKVALVGRPEWASSFAEYLGLATNVKFKYFQHGLLPQALEWLRA